ncbi:PREDICTED: putative protein TPRXL [Rhagoletis zephyria]|uniref:putative protein TPRXL n=1 Tax=Rhagoletis zephyria TaxID=28612 RepID=UPI00081124EC|nr:PREDICTED: putative protein TPRXL [Rhagoletis zephyria]XP_017493658.1 PREDICTED: putative protein TPRXL [Rhagoletis zephyria]
MVTTIKITCDGVFIQSNSYLTPTESSNNVAHRSTYVANGTQHSPKSATSLATSTTTATSFAICSDDPSNSDGSANEFEHSLRQRLRHLNSPKVALISATISSCSNINNNDSNHNSRDTNGKAHATFNSFSSTTSPSSSSHSSFNSHASNASQRQRRRRSNSSSPVIHLNLLLLPQQVRTHLMANRQRWIRVGATTTMVPAA